MLAIHCVIYVKGFLLSSALQIKLVNAFFRLYVQSILKMIRKQRYISTAWGKNSSTNIFIIVKEKQKTSYFFKLLDLTNFFYK